MLSPKDIANHEFQTVSRNAYRASDVDAYLEEVQSSYEQMFRENAELLKKINMLADKLAEYKSDSDNIRNALVTAERMKEQITQEAETQAQEVLRDAEHRARTAIEAVNTKTAETMERAQQSAEKVMLDANLQAATIVEEAKENASALLTKAQKIYSDQMGSIEEDVKRERDNLQTMRASAGELKESLTELYRKHIHIIEEIPTFAYAQEEQGNAPVPQATYQQQENIFGENAAEEAQPEEHYAQEEDTSCAPAEEAASADAFYVARGDVSFETAEETAPVDEYLNDDFDEQEEDAFSENVPFSVNIDNLYAQDGDDDVLTLQNFFNENQE